MTGRQSSGEVVAGVVDDGGLECVVVGRAVLDVVEGRRRGPVVGGAADVGGGAVAEPGGGGGVPAPWSPVPGAAAVVATVLDSGSAGGRCLNRTVAAGTVSWSVTAGSDGPSTAPSATGAAVVTAVVVDGSVAGTVVANRGDAIGGASQVCASTSCTRLAWTA